MQVTERIDKEVVARIEDRTTTPITRYKTIPRRDWVQVTTTTEMPNLDNARSMTPFTGLIYPIQSPAPFYDNHLPVVLQGQSKSLKDGHS